MRSSPQACSNCATEPLSTSITRFSRETIRLPNPRTTDEDHGSLYQTTRTGNLRQFGDPDSRFAVVSFAERTAVSAQLHRVGTSAHVLCRREPCAVSWILQHAPVPRHIQFPST